MKVLTLTTLFPNYLQPLHGIFIFERIRHLAKLCPVEVVAPILLPPPKEGGLSSSKISWRKMSQISPYEIKENLSIHHPKVFYLPKIDRTLRWVNYFIRLYPLLKQIKYRFDFDIIDAHWVYPDGLAALLLGKILNVPVVVSCRGSDVNLYPDFPIIGKLVKYTLHKCDAIITVSEALKNKVISLEISPEKIEVIANGVDPKKFFYVSRKTARKDLDIPLEKRVVLSIGHLVERKGFHHLIDAMNHLVNKKKYRDLLLVIVGEGPYRNVLEKKIKNYGLQSHVLLVGAKPFNEIPLWHNIADIFCLASSREGWPNVIFEALASGSPVVATNAWGNREVICSKDYGILVDQQCGKELAKAIARALETKWDKKKIIKYACDNNWDIVATKVFKYLNKTIQNGCRTSSQN